MDEYLSQYKSIRNRMLASSYPAIHSPATAAQFALDGLRAHPDYAQLALTLHSKLTTFSSVDQIEAELIQLSTSSQ